MKAAKVLGIATAVAVCAVVPALAQLSENFDSYAPGSQMIGQGGWEGWWLDPNAGALVSTEQAHSASNSVKCELTSDLVHPFLGATAGQWEMTAWQFIPSGNIASTYFIGNNAYDGPGGTAQWSIEVNFTSGGKVLDDFRTESNDINTVYNAWAKLHFDIDLVANTMQTYYNDVLLSDGVYNAQGGPLELQNIDLFSNGPVEYFDDIELEEVGGPDTCSYEVANNVKSKNGCQACPNQGDRYDFGTDCDDNNPCKKKATLKNVDCPDGNPGTCKKIKGAKNTGECG